MNATENQRRLKKLQQSQKTVRPLSYRTARNACSHRAFRLQCEVGSQAVRNLLQWAFRMAYAHEQDCEKTVLQERCEMDEVERRLAALYAGVPGGEDCGDLTAPRGVSQRF